MWRVCLTFILVCVGCGGSGSGHPAGASITAVSVSGPSTLAYNATATLTATVQGTGNFSPVVNWVINSGGGRLSATTGASVQYTAPLALSAAAVEIDAISDADHSKVGRLAVSITPAPPAEQALAGSYQGSLHDYQYRLGVGGMRIVLVDTNYPTATYAFSATGPNAANFRDVVLCPNGIPVEVHGEGTLAFTAFNCRSVIIGCQVQVSVLGGTGTWDYSGSLQFVLHLLQSSCAGNVFMDETFTNGHKQ